MKNVFSLFTASRKAPLRHRRNTKRPSRLAALKRGLGHGFHAIGDGIRSVTLFFGGSHPMEVAPVPGAEIRSLRVDGLLLILSMTINGVIWASALVSAGKPAWIALPIALLITTVIGLFDRQILSSLLNMEGEQIVARLDRRGFYPVDRRRRWLLTGARIALSLASMYAAMLLLRVSLFAPDIEAHLQHKYQVLNRDVRVHAEQIIDGQIGDSHRAFEKAVAERNELRSFESETDKPADTTAIDGEMETARAEVMKARSDLQALNLQRAEHMRGASAEDAGEKDRQSDTGNMGQGSRYRFHTLRAKDIAGQMNLTYRIMKVAERRLQVLQLERQRELAAKGQLGVREKFALRPRLEQADRRVGAMAAKRERLEGNRASMVERMMKESPAYAAPRMGLMARVEALDEIQKGSWSAWLLSLAITAVTSILELAVVWSRAVLGSPHPAGFFRVLANVRAVEAELGPSKRRRYATAAPENDNPVGDNDRDVA
jgi:hypothetical protein